MTMYARIMNFHYLNVKTKTQDLQDCKSTVIKLYELFSEFVSFNFSISSHL
jgi:hypothetical protein